jgi:diguanylate cyclase (GGDEF)-like protein
MTSKNKKKHPVSVENLYHSRGASTTQQLEVTRQLVMLHTASAQISSSLEVDQVSNIVTRELNNIFSTSLCILRQWNKEEGAIRKVATHEVVSPLKRLDESSLYLSEFPLRAKSLNEQKVIQTTVSDPNIDAAEAKFLKEHGFKSLLLLPLIHHNETIGLIETYDINERIYEIHEIVSAKLYANHAAIAIENALLYDKAQDEINIRKQVEEKLRHDALHDSLTGLPNRNLFLDRLERAILRRKRFPGGEFSVLYLDLDRFKIINDTFGHAEGDQILIEIANVLKSCVREIDTISRFGGDEFLILIEGNINPKSASQFADRILTELNTPIKTAGVDFIPSASIGIVMSSADYETPEEYIQDADIAMYHAKSHGKGRYEIFSSTKGLRARSRLVLEKELNQAVNNQDFLLHYQPIFELESQKIVGLEALLRWSKGKGKLVFPNEFLPVLEDIGVLFDVGIWAVEEACKHVLRWQEANEFDPPLSLSVNFSSSQLTYPYFVPMVNQTLADCRFDANHFIVEITENILVKETSLVTNILYELKKLGINIHLDDFGTGFSSLSYLKNLPIDAIKIGYEFIDQIDPGKKDQGLLDVIISMAEKLEMDTIAEGVETEIQANKLRELGCHYAQGFFFKKGLEAAGIEKYLKKYRQTLKSMEN